jgi:HEAT repeat protein
MNIEKKSDGDAKRDVAAEAPDVPAIAPIERGPLAPEEVVEEVERAIARLRAAHQATDERLIAIEETGLAAVGGPARGVIGFRIESERHPGVRASLRLALLSIDGQLRPPDLVPVIRDEPNQAVKNRLALALGRIGDADDARYLADVARTDADVVLRSLALRALGRMPIPESAAALSAIARDEANATLRLEAVRALARLSVGGAVESLMDLARNEREGTIRHAALGELAAHGRNASAFFSRVLAQSYLTSERLEAARYFARAGRADDLKEVEQAIARERDGPVRKELERARAAIKSRWGGG